MPPTVVCQGAKCANGPIQIKILGELRGGSWVSAQNMALEHSQRASPSTVAFARQTLVSTNSICSTDRYTPSDTLVQYDTAYRADKHYVLP